MGFSLKETSSTRSGAPKNRQVAIVSLQSTRRAWRAAITVKTGLRFVRRDPVLAFDPAHCPA